MKVSKFMIPREKVVTVPPGAPISTTLKTMIDEKVGCVVVADGTKAYGVVTKTDACRAYHQGLPLDSPTSEIMSKTLVTVDGEMGRDQVAETMSDKHVHHCVVLDADRNFLGLVSSWDIAREIVLDNKAWPWNRESPMFGSSLGGK